MRESAVVQVAAALADSSLVDAIVPNVDDSQAVLRSLKEAAAMLSPIVRNRICGIPQYILEYSDLVVANHVQAPFLKPIVVTGPDTGERAELLQALADEFPDVFVFAPVVSDEPTNPPSDPFLKRSVSEVSRFRIRYFVIRLQGDQGNEALPFQSISTFVGLPTATIP